MNIQEKYRRNVKKNNLMQKLQRLLTYSQMLDEIEQNVALYKRLFLTRNLTARKVAENQNVALATKQDVANWSKALLRNVGSKNLGHGGARVGSGNKKGVRLCKNDTDVSLPPNRTDTEL